MRRIEWITLTVALLLMLAGCRGDGSSSNPTCTDADGDTYGAFCAAGPDCDDADPNNWDACAACVDADGDSSFVGCDAYATIAGPDCDDADVDNQTSCSTCVDADGDLSFVGCDAYTTRAGPDCNDADVDNQTSCSTCLDADGDSSFVGCDAYTTRAGPDCNDGDADNQTSCATCLDGDGDGAFAGCDAYATRVGPDCDDADADSFNGAAPNDSATACMTDADGDDWGDLAAPAGGVAGTDCDDANASISPGAAENETGLGCVEDADDDGYASTVAPPGGVAGTDCDDTDLNNWASCTSCTDGDLDLSYVSCDAYVTVSGPDCDDVDPNRSTIEPELADDGVDNDCSGADLVAATAVGATYVDVGNGSCTNGAGAGSQATPYCSLEDAIEDSTSGAEIFVAEGTYPVTEAIVFASDDVSIYGGYDGSWTRNLATRTTTIDTSGFSARGLLITADRIVLDGLAFVRGVANTGFGSDVILQIGEFGAITRSTFDMAGGTPEILRISGYSSIAERTTHALVRGVQAITDGAREFVEAARFQTFRFEQNRVDNLNPPGVSYVVISDSDNEFIVNNVIWSGGYGSAFSSDPDSGTSYVVGNSIYKSGSTGGTELNFRAGEQFVLNNAYRDPAATARFAGSITFSLPNVLPFTILNNIREGTLGSFGLLDTVPGTAFESWSTAADANACTLCVAGGGNQDAAIGFVDGPNGDLRLGSGSVAIDAGVDPTPYVPYFRVREDIDGNARPVDGDGLGGAQWDVGAYER